MYCRRAREYIKESLITYSNSWKYWYVAKRSLEYRKSDKQISVDMEQNYGTQISQKHRKEKSQKS